MVLDAAADRLERERVARDSQTWHLAHLVWRVFNGKAPAFDAFVYPRGRPSPSEGRGNTAARFRAWVTSQSHGAE